MATGEESVFRRAEGTGDATIYGGPGNIMRAISQRKANIQHNEAVQFEREKIARQERDKRMAEILAVDPEKAYEPFNQQVQDAANSHRNRIVDYLDKGGSPDNPTFKAAVKKGWDDVNSLARKSQYIKSTIEEVRKDIEKNPYLNSEYYNPKLWDMYMDAHGNGKPLSQVDIGSIRDIYKNDPMGFNDAKYTKDFTDGLNKNVANYVSQKAQNNGILTEDTETKWMDDLYTRDKTSPIGVKVDEKGNPILNMNSTVFNSFLNSDTAKGYYENIAKQSGQDVKDIIASRVGAIDINTKPSFNRNQSWWYDFMNGGRLKPKEKEIANKTFETIDSIVNAFTGPDGKPVSESTPEARAAIGHLKQGIPFGNGKSVDAELVRGTNRPGTSNIMGMKSPNSSNDRLVIKVRTAKGDRLEEIDLTDEGAGTNLYDALVNSGYQGKNSIPFDQAAKELNFNPTKLYKGREYKALNQQKEQAQINSWTKGEDTGKFIGKSYKGTPIVGVDKVNSYGGLGGFKAFRLKLADGTTADVSKDDYDTFTDIVQSEEAQPQEKSVPSTKGKKSLGVKWD